MRKYQSISCQVNKSISFSLNAKNELNDGHFSCPSIFGIGGERCGYGETAVFEGLSLRDFITETTGHVDIRLSSTATEAHLLIKIKEIEN